MTMTGRKASDANGAIVGFFGRALAGFQASRVPFQVICTLPPRAGPNTNSLWVHDPAPVGRPFPTRTLVVLDSSFNPPTRAHLHMASSAIRDVREKHKTTTRLLLLLAVNNADKAPKPAVFEQRLALMWAFARDVASHVDQGSPVVDDIAIDVGLTTQPYFHDKSAAIAAVDFYGPGETEHVFLVGYDTLVRILDPKYYQADQAAGTRTPLQAALGPLFGRARLRVTLRADAEWGSGDEQQAWVGDLVEGDGLTRLGGHGAWAEKIDVVQGPVGPAVSSTLARQAVAASEWHRVDEMVPPAVAEWVKREGLYLD